MNPEFLKECMELYKSMIPEDFILMVYHAGSYAGRIEEIKAALASIDRITRNDYSNHRQDPR